MNNQAEVVCQGSTDGATQQTTEIVAGHVVKEADPNSGLAGVELTSDDLKGSRLRNAALGNQESGNRDADIANNTDVNSTSSLDVANGWLKRLQHCREQLPMPYHVVRGLLTGISGITLTASGVSARVGELCRIEQPNDILQQSQQQAGSIEAQVIGFADGVTRLMTLDPAHGLTPGAVVVPLRRGVRCGVGPALIGRVIDASGKALDGRGALMCDEQRELTGEQINPLQRLPIDEPLDVGVRAINSLLTLGRGQRVGLFAGSGVGKSVLLGMITRGTSADVTVVCLLGERGREVAEFVHQILGSDGLQKSVVVAIPADNTPLRRVNGARMATTIAEYYRDQGLDVLLVVDSLTRYAQAQREIGLAAGELPVARGYPTSVFTGLPFLLERCGRTDSGSITALYTVLYESKDGDDPVADAVRAILDGHIVLSAELAMAGHYPAIDLLASTSRLRDAVTAPAQKQSIEHFIRLYAVYQKNRDLLAVGMYQRGSDPLLDLAISMMPQLQDFLQQSAADNLSLPDCLVQLSALFHNRTTTVGG